MTRKLFWRAVRPRRGRGWLWLVLTVGVLLNGLRLRPRLTGLQTLEPAEAPNGAGEDDFLLLHLPGVGVEAATVALATRHAHREDLDVLDLVPRDLSGDDALDLARGVDTRTYRSSPLAPGRGARHAVLVRRRVAHAAGATAPSNQADFVALYERLKPFAARSTDLAVAPGLAVVTPTPGERLRELKHLYGPALPVAIGFPAARSSLLMAGLALSPGWGAAALAAFVAQPYLVTSGTALDSPSAKGLSFSAVLSRLWQPFAIAGAVVAARSDGAEVDPIEAVRGDYTTALAGGTERFFEPRRDTCPWCAGRALSERIRTPDMIQSKPGEFVIDECQSCGYLFQNPRLSIEGLDFYYRDAYDGLGAGATEFLFANSEPSYRGRVELAVRHGSPRTWLDVGTGYGHFCVIAQGLLPDTRFDGLDMGTSVEEGQRRGWVDRAYRGFFPDLVAEVKGKYDVISMHHYLEHTRDPRAELEAARDALEPGGFLLVEVPDPESRFGHLLGRYWLPWFQPQHQQFLSLGHLTAALETEGFSVVEVERGPAHQPVDLGAAIWQWAATVAPPPRTPWRDSPTAAEGAQRAAVLTAVALPALLGLLADRILHPLIRARGKGWSNAYRLLARRQ